MPEIALAKIPAEAPLDRASLFACGLSTGLGAVLTTARVEPGSTCVVFGAGMVGLGAVAGARLAGAERIVCVDLSDDWLELARGQGATHLLQGGSDAVQAILDLTDGFGADYTFEATGNVGVMRQAVEAARMGWGLATVAGVAWQGRGARGRAAGAHHRPAGLRFLVRRPEGPRRRAPARPALARRRARLGALRLARAAARRRQRGLRAHGGAGRHPQRPALRLGGAVPVELPEGLLRTAGALAGADLGITVGDAAQPGFPLVYANEAFERMTGYPSEDCLGRKCSLLQDSATDSAELQRLREALAARRDVQVTLRNRRKDGEVFWNELRVVSLREEGRLRYVLGFQLDVTHTVETVRRLREVISEQERELTELRAVREALTPPPTLAHGGLDVATAFVPAESGVAGSSSSPRPARGTPSRSRWATRSGMACARRSRRRSCARACRPSPGSPTTPSACSSSRTPSRASRRATGCCSSATASPRPGAPRGSAGAQRFGDDRVAARVRELRGEPAQRVIEGLLAEVRRAVDGPLQDDLCAAAVRGEGTPPSPGS